MSAIHKQRLHFYEFGPFRLDAEERLLFRAQEVVPLTPKVFETLLVLVENRGRLLEKDALMNAVWPDTFVEESSLAQNISLLRKALGEEHGGREYIETLPKRGYRFLAEVREVRDDGGAFLLHRTNSHVLIEEEETQSSTEQTEVKRLPSASGILRWQTYAVVACAVVGLVAAVYFWQSRGRATDPGLAPKSIAVLPFKTVGAESETELLGLGMADALVLNLAQQEQLSVIPTSSVFKYMKRDEDALAIGRDLGVEAVLDGTIQRSGENVRVTAQLIRLSDGKTVWSGKFDEQFKNIFALHDSVSRQLAQALTLKVSNQNANSLPKRYTESAEAYELYTRGFYFWNKRTSEGGLFKAVEYFKQATEKDPNYALGYAMLADSYKLMIHYRLGSTPREELHANAKAAAERAFALDPSLPEAYAALGCVKGIEGDYAEAMNFYRKAIELNPNFGTAHLRYGYMLANQGRLDEAITQMSRAHELDPLSATINTNLSAYLMYKGRSDEALHHAQMALETNPDMAEPRVNLGEAYESKKMYKEAEEAYRTLATNDSNTILAKQQLAYLYAVQGDVAEARKLLAEVEVALRDGKAFRTTPYSIGQVYIALGQLDDAFKWMNKAADEKALVQPDFWYSAKLEPMRKDPRFEPLREKVLARIREANTKRVKD